MLPISLFCVLFLIKDCAFSSHHDTETLQDGDRGNEIIEGKCCWPDKIHIASSVFCLNHIPFVSLNNSTQPGA